MVHSFRKVSIWLLLLLGSHTWSRYCCPILTWVPDAMFLTFLQQSARWLVWNLMALVVSHVYVMVRELLVVWDVYFRPILIVVVYIDWVLHWWGQRRRLLGQTRTAWDNLLIQTLTQLVGLLDSAWLMLCFIWVHQTCANMTLSFFANSDRIFSLETTNIRVDLTTSFALRALISLH